ncbi:AraC family transcriptional regulator ligand-binding domain-containing protein [Nocardia sp. NPDC059091]|uniref:AraC family transcriptional regulator ligand-binding domain-containing protein n=1 Tax=unclassified Nocardia TaxID=2637762 RepID=UPI00367398DB
MTIHPTGIHAPTGAGLDPDAQVMDTVLLPGYVLSTIGVCEDTRHRLALAADLPGWLLTSPESMVPSERYLRLWELVEHETQDPAIAVRTALEYTPGQLGIIDYLLLTAPTLGAGLALTDRFMDACSTNREFRAVADADPDGMTTVYTGLARGEGRGSELAMHTGLCGMIVKMRTATGQHVVPVDVRLRQRAPKGRAELTALAELFGTPRIDFGAATNRVTFRNADLALPLLRADPVLNRILVQQAEMTAPPRITTWSDRLQQELASMLIDGAVTIDAVARRLLTGRRTLQRRLAEEGTSWRYELEKARRQQVLDQPLGLTQAERARRLGYSDPRSLRRAQQRWTDVS